MLAVRTESRPMREDLVGLLHQRQGKARMAPLASCLAPALDALAARLAGWAIGGRRLTAVMTLFPEETLSLVLPCQNLRQLVAQGLDFCTQGGVFSFQV